MILGVVGARGALGLQVEALEMLTIPSWWTLVFLSAGWVQLMTGVLMTADDWGAFNT